MKQLIFILLLSFSGFAQLSGSYTVGQSGTYPDLDSAISDLNNQGISGSVEFVVENGTYTQLIINNFDPGVDSLMIRSASGIADSVIINRGWLTNSNRITLSHLTFQMPPVSNLVSVVKLTVCDDIHFNACKVIDTVTTNFNSNEGGIKIDHGFAQPFKFVYIDTCYIYTLDGSLGFTPGAESTIVEKGNTGRIYYNNDSIFGGWNLPNGGQRQIRNCYLMIDNGIDEAGTFIIDSCEVDIFPIMGNLQVSANSIKNSTFSGNTVVDMTTDNIINCVFNVEARSSYNLGTLIKDNRFYSDFRCSYGQGNKYENNDFYDFTIASFENAMAVNNRFYDTLDIGFGYFHLVHNSFGPSSLLIDVFSNGELRNNLINTYAVYQGDNSNKVFRHNNWIGTDIYTNYYAGFDDAPTRYDPQFTSATDLHINNPALFERAEFLTEPLTVEDMDDEARLQYRTPGADEVCLSLPLPDTVFVDCGTEYMLKSCQSLQDSNYIWKPGTAMIDSMAQYLLVAVDSTITVWLEDSLGNVIDQMVLTPAALPLSTVHNLYTYCGFTIPMGAYLPIAGEISWSPNTVSDTTSSEVTVYVDTSSVYVATIQLGQCGSFTDTFYINVNQSPQVAIYLDSIDCATGYFDPYINCYDSLLWDFGDGNISTVFNPVHTYAIEANYQVSLIVWNAGYVDSATVNIYFGCSGLSENERSLYKLYPNPTNELITVEASTSCIGESFIILNTLGEVVQSGIINDEQTDIPMLKQAPGNYLFISKGQRIQFIKN